MVSKYLFRGLHEDEEIYDGLKVQNYDKEYIQNLNYFQREEKVNKYCKDHFYHGNIQKINPPVKSFSSLINVALEYADIRANKKERYTDVLLIKSNLLNSECIRDLSTRPKVASIIDEYDYIDLNNPYPSGLCWQNTPTYGKEYCYVGDIDKEYIAVIPRVLAETLGDITNIDKNLLNEFDEIINALYRWDMLLNSLDFVEKEEYKAAAEIKYKKLIKNYLIGNYYSWQELIVEERFEFLNRHKEQRDIIKYAVNKCEKSTFMKGRRRAEFLLDKYIENEKGFSETITQSCKNGYFQPQEVCFINEYYINKKSLNETNFKIHEEFQKNSFNIDTLHKEIKDKTLVVIQRFATGI